MLRVKLSCLATVLLVLAGCASTKDDKTAGWSPNRIYAEAKDEMNSSAWDKAVPLLEKLEGRAAGTPLAQQAQLEKAYAQYRGGDRPRPSPPRPVHEAAPGQPRRSTTRCTSRAWSTSTTTWARWPG
jgi:uncharacterized protein YceK